jgi:hypothetical protein
MSQKNDILVKNGTKLVFTHFKLPWCFSVNAVPVLGHLSRLELGCSAEVSEEHVTSIFRIELNNIDFS